MLASISLKAMVAIAVAHLSLSVLPGTFANAIESGHSSAPMQRRSLDLGRVTRLHRHRRRSTNLPKPNGTSGAANNDEENVKLLEAYATHLSAVNKAVSSIQDHVVFSQCKVLRKFMTFPQWQNQAMQDLKDGKTPVLFDEFQQNYEKSSTSSQTTNNDVNHHHHHQKAAAAGQQHGEQVKSGDASHTSDGEEYNSGQDKQKQQEEEKEKKDQEKKDQEEKRRKDAEEADQKKQAKGKEAEEEQKQKNAQQAEEEQRKQDNENKKKEEEQKKKEAAAKQQQQSTNQDQNTNKGKSNTSGPVAQYMGQGFDGDMTYYDVSTTSQSLSLSLFCES